MTGTLVRGTHSISASQIASQTRLKVRGGPQCVFLQLRLRSKEGPKLDSDFEGQIPVAPNFVSQLACRWQTSWDAGFGLIVRRPSSLEAILGRTLKFKRVWKQLWDPLVVVASMQAQKLSIHTHTTVRSHFDSSRQDG